MGSKQRKKKSQGWCSGRIPVVPAGHEVEYNVTCNRCGTRETVLSLIGRFPRHTSTGKDRYFCLRSGASYLPSEVKGARWRLVEKIVVPQADERHARPVPPRVVSVVPKSAKGGQKTSDRLSSPLVDGRDVGAQARLQAARRNYSSDLEQANDSRYQASREVYGGSTSVVARSSPSQGTGRRR